MAQKHLRNVQTAAKKLGECRARLGDAMLTAQRSGESVRHIAEWADMSPTTTQRLLDEAKGRERKRE